MFSLVWKQIEMGMKFAYLGKEIETKKLFDVNLLEFCKFLK